jgi:hypothetical protein
MATGKSEIRLSKRLFVEYGEAIEKVLRQAVDQALLTHRRLGNSIAVWENGKVVIIPPERIRTSTESDQSTD